MYISMLYFISKHDIQMTNKNMKICSISLVIKKMQIKMGWHFAPTKMAVVKATITDGEDVEKLKPSCVVRRNVKW